MVIAKTKEQLQRECAELEQRIRQHQNRLQRLEQRTKHIAKGERQKRAHRLITRGAAVESVAPTVRNMSEHESELRQFYLARRKLSGVILTDEWQRELATLECADAAVYAEYKALHSELTKLLDVKYCVDRALSAREDKSRKTRLLDKSQLIRALKP